MINIQTEVHVPITNAWKYWTETEHITKWNFASDDWHCPKAINKPMTGGSFTYTMAAKDGSAQFDFEGRYLLVEVPKKIEYLIVDGRRVIVHFESTGPNSVRIMEQFEPEQIHSEELQRKGWQSILDQFKKYAESVG